MHDREARLLARIAELEARVQDSEDTLDAIRRGEVDALVLGHDAESRQVFTLRTADHPYRVLIEQIQEGAATFTEDGTVLYCNRRMADLLGTAQERVIGQSLRPYALENSLPVLDRLLQLGRHTRSRSEIVLRTKNGTEVPVYVSLSPLQNEDGSTLLCGVLTDLTEQKLHMRELADANTKLLDEIAQREQLEDALRQSQKMEAVGQLTGGVAHDFNNLLTVIRSSTDLLMRPGLTEERRTRVVGAISDTVNRAAKLTGQLLAFARRQTLKPEVFAVCDSVRSIVDMIGTLTGSRIEIVTRFAGEGCFVNADTSQFDTALVNMAVNARDAMDGNGRLTISVDAVDGIAAVHGGTATAREFAAISITDTGTGIAPENIQRIFEPFYTTKVVGQGTGLGLSQVFGFAKQSGGEVVARSELGVGTTFVLYLPRVPPPAPSTLVETPKPEPLANEHGIRVLVVEDNVDVGLFATQTLAELGYVATLAPNAERALDELCSNAGRFDVVFSDVVMPGMNGLDLAKAIHGRYPDLPVILASGYSHVLAREGSQGFELLQKPYLVEQLSRVLSKVSRQRR